MDRVVQQTDERARVRYETNTKRANEPHSQEQRASVKQKEQRGVRQREADMVPAAIHTPATAEYRPAALLMSRGPPGASHGQHERAAAQFCNRAGSKSRCTSGGAQRDLRKGASLLQPSHCHTGTRARAMRGQVGTASWEGTLSH